MTVVKGSFSMPAQSFISAEEEGKQENASGTVLRLRINPGVPELVAAAKRNGHHVAIISGGFGHFVKAVAVYLGISFSICNEAETEERDEDASSVGGIDARGNEANEAVESDKGIKIPFSCSGKEVRETGHSASAVNDRLILTGRLRNASINFNNKSNQHDYSFIVHGMQHHLPQIIERAGKAKSLLLLAEALDVPRDRIVAVGDGANDLDMLGVAAIGIAWNGKPVVRERAPMAFHSMGMQGIADILYPLME